MLRPPLLVSAIVIVISLAASAAVAPAASPEGGTIVTVELELPASHGLQAKLETSADEMVTLELERDDRFVIYEVKGKVTEAGLRVRFGRLGIIDVAFTPTKTLSSTEPSEGCVGEPRTLREGTFTGTIEFTGERQYVRIEGPQAEGSMSVISEWQCPGGEELMSLEDASQPTALSSREEGGSASLYALNSRCSCGFYAGVRNRNGGGKSIFFGVKGEHREGMEISRATVAHAGASAFVFDHAAGTATVRPPRPFSGHATFRSRPHDRELWRSTIRVPLLGAAPLRPNGPGFRAVIFPGYDFD
jgi:hypothetical protein